MTSDPLAHQTSLTSLATTSFDLYLCGPSLSLTGFPPEGGHTNDLVKDLLKSELKGHIIFEGDLNIKHSDSLFHHFIPKSLLKTKARGTSIEKKPEANEKNSNSESDNSDDESHPSTEVADTDTEALDSQCSWMMSQDTDGTWSRDEYDGTAELGSKRARKPSSTEKDLQCLFKAVQYVLRQFANSPIPDPYNAQKPDLALFYYKSKVFEKAWTDTLSFVEHTSSDFSKRRDLGVYWGSATKAYLIMREQPWRRFVLSFFISAEQLYAHFCDHSGLIVTLPTSIQSSPARVADAIATLSLVDPTLLGLNPTIHMCIPSCKGTHTDLAEGAISWVTNNHGKIYSILAVLWKSQGLFCHGTVCYRVRDPVDGKEYAMKDCWVAEAKRYHEVDVLERVKNIPNVVQLVDHWDVLFDGEPDCTARIQDRYGILPEDRPDKRDPLWHFSSRKELICTFRDFVVGIGYFIDFDHVSIMKEGETFTISFGTGTVPYISMRILKTMSKNADILKKSKTSINAKKNSTNTNSIAQLKLVEHNPSDDLESLFYIFFEFVSKYGGAHGAVAPTWDKTTMPWAV
ncbi:uncharacterized protein F5891DRAFT_1194328 [Suillus fuscotomentosus]|uniref:Fungal-type protein kinase domain-containing protein n=1 Tax=Suillus fuscotomentosus TaxID=1912939 RepID=A0AAD4DWB0_9AGAM|nr:uncharacterized protein F5891DRAFT_1194328 [Suillus fuscotomentosus]KAG1895270.1 hypothetical protein F5891DRAFT_1194328 [Suillus fuscotomentosus]